jgi:hypothetical protein
MHLLSHNHVHKNISPYTTRLSFLQIFSEQDNSIWYDQLPTAAQLEEALHVGHAGLIERDKLEKTGMHLDNRSVSYRHQMAMRTSQEASRLARAGYVLVLAARHLAER